MCGLNPHADLIELFQTYLYQRLPGLLELDAANLGLEVVIAVPYLLTTYLFDAVGLRSL